MFTSVPVLAAADLTAPIAGRYSTGVVELPDDATLADVARAMLDHQTHAVLVRGGDGAAIGWATARGMLHNRPGDWSRATAGEAAIETVAAVPADGTLADAVDALLASGASHVLVTDPGRTAAVGVLSDRDVAACLAAGAAVSRDLPDPRLP
jgi:CBS domain-containing protein